MLRGFLAALLLAALAPPASAARRKDTLIYSRFDIDAGEWRYFEFPAKSGEARLEVRFEVLSPKESQGVRITVLKEREFDKYRENQPHQDFQTTPYQRTGSLRTKLTDPGGYVVIVDNRQETKRHARVDLEVTLSTGPDPDSLPVAYASARKRWIVVTVSLAVFAAMLLVFGRALWRATRRPASLWSF